ncbi:MAG: dihydrolipoyl dehydrogenase family protein [Trueperaceae bacterium]
MIQFRPVEFHTAVIGAGSAGLTVAVGLSGLGKSVALIEKKHIGGDCTNVGCVPSKTLIHLASHLSEHKLSTPEILAKVRERRDHLREEETTWIKGVKNLTVFEGEAAFVNSTTLSLNLPTGEQTITAKHIVIASGSSPIVPSIPGLPPENILTNESLFDVTQPLKHFVIIGGGIIGCEMAFAFRKLGSNVTIVQRAPKLLDRLEPEVSELMETRCKEVGIKVIVNATAQAFEEKGLRLEQRGQSLRVEEVDKVLVAVGRKPNLGFALEKTSVTFTDKGVLTSKRHRTNVPTIYAIGDVSLTSAFTHTANAQGRRVVQSIALPFLPQSKEAVYPNAVFTDPEIAQVGPSLATLQETYHPNLLRTLRFALKKTDRGYTQGLEHGFILIHTMRLTGRVLSATIVAPNASEMISILTLAIKERISLYKLANVVFPYPVLSEAIKKLSDQFVFATLPKLPQELAAYVRYRWVGIERKEKGES